MSKLGFIRVPRFIDRQHLIDHLKSQGYTEDSDYRIRHDRIIDTLVLYPLDWSVFEAAISLWY